MDSIRSITCCGGAFVAIEQLVNALAGRQNGATRNGTAIGQCDLDGDQRFGTVIDAVAFKHGDLKGHGSLLSPPLCRETDNLPLTQTLTRPPSPPPKRPRPPGGSLAEAVSERRP